jgi:hypothetical protein
MKKLLLLIVAFALVSGVASASTMTIQCLNPNAVSPNGSSILALTELDCPQWNGLPGGDYLSSVTLDLEDSFNQGQPINATNQFTFTYTNVDSDVGLVGPGGSPNGCILPTGSSNTCQDTITGTAAAGTNLGLGVYYQLGAIITTDLAHYLGSGNFMIADVAGQPGPLGGAVLGTGQISASSFVTFTYYPNNITPEPMTMMLVGGGLLGLGLLVSKRRKKA